MNSHDAQRPYVEQFNHNVNQIINVQSNVKNVHLTNFVCDRSGKMYPDPDTQCQVKNVYILYTLYIRIIYYFI